VRLVIVFKNMHQVEILGDPPKVSQKAIKARPANIFDGSDGWRYSMCNPFERGAVVMFCNKNLLLRELVA
jgi:hypothetical protein